MFLSKIWSFLMSPTMKTRFCGLKGVFSYCEIVSFPIFVLGVLYRLWVFQNQKRVPTWTVFGLVLACNWCFCSKRTVTISVGGVSNSPSLRDHRFLKKFETIQPTSSLVRSFCSMCTGLLQ